MERNQVLHQAGGVVIRGQKVLMLTSQRNFSRWLFPKGDIDQGETPEVAARREVHEEAGVVAEPVRLLGSVSYADPPFTIELQLYLMRYVGESGHPYERRLRRWVSLEESVRRHHLGAKIVPVVRAARALPKDRQ